ncbi:MAG TPA: glycosyltransferase [Moheibacter sp.]|nr:glycosyltransferase [Moheibacter sp.]
MKGSEVKSMEMVGVEEFSFQSKLSNLSKKEWLVVIGAQVLMIASIWLMGIFHPYFEALHLERMQTLGGRIVIYTLLGLLGFQLLFFAFTTYLYFKYKSIASVSDDLLPKTTVIIPAYNEGKLVFQTLLSIAKSDFPMDKLEIIAIDDGSSDDTWFWINKANSELGGQIKVHKQPQNKGKRWGLYHGFTHGNGEVFLTIDSDSIIEKNTIRNMVSPFVVDEKCGAVAGNVKVLNKDQGMIPRMLHVSFTFSFEFIRSAQSALGFVLCTPGALSAYRREAVFHCLNDWIHQKFLGQEATIGEDRAMTNMILKQGYDVKFQRNANVLTNTPISFRNLHKMFTRWGRSNVRETLMMSQFMFKNFRKGNKMGARFIFINQWMKLLLAVPMFLMMFVFFLNNPLLYLCTVLVGAFVFSSIQVLFFSKRYNLSEALWAYPYSLFYLFALCWIFPFAITTVRNGGWLTR